MTYEENLKSISKIILSNEYHCPTSMVHTPFHFLCKILNAYKSLQKLDYVRTVDLLKQLSDAVQRMISRANNIPAFDNGFEEMYNQEYAKDVEPAKITRKRYTCSDLDSVSAGKIQRWGSSNNNYIPSPPSKLNYKPSVSFDDGSETPAPMVPSPFDMRNLPATPRSRSNSVTLRRSFSISSRKSLTQSRESSRSLSPTQCQSSRSPTHSQKSHSSRNSRSSSRSQSSGNSKSSSRSQSSGNSKSSSKSQSSGKSQTTSTVCPPSSFSIPAVKRLRTPSPAKSPSIAVSSPKSPCKKNKSKSKALILLFEKNVITCKWGYVSYLRNILKKSNILLCLLEKTNTVNDMRKIWEDTRNLITTKYNLHKVNVRSVLCKESDDIDKIKQSVIKCNYSGFDVIDLYNY